MPNGASSIGPEIRSVKPWRPEKGASGADMPAIASCTPKTAFRTAYAVATPFHIESWPARVARIGTFATQVMAMAFRATSRLSPIQVGEARRSADADAEALVPALLAKPAR